MKKLRVLAAGVVVALAALTIWKARSGSGAGESAANSSDESANAYDYEARDVVVRQMGPDGALQYELEAKQITQLPRKGQITAQDLTMHYDPAGSPAGGPNRWTLTANRADLPESGGEITLQGKVHGEGRPQNSRTTVSLSTERLTYNLETQDVCSNVPVNFKRGNASFQSGDLCMNIKRGTYNVESPFNGTIAP